MPGVLLNKIKYIKLCNDNDFKKKSLYDNVYFTLRDIFANAASCDDFMEANIYNKQLTGGITFENRTEMFEYNNVLEQPYFVECLLTYLNTFENDTWFEFTEPDDEEDIDETTYMKFDDWWFQFEELRRLIRELS